MGYILKIKELLTEKKITQKEFSKKIDKNVHTVSNYFTGKTKIDVETLIKIAKVLNVSVNYFFDNEQSTFVDNKEFDLFLNNNISENELLLGKLNNILLDILERVECGFMCANDNNLFFDFDVELLTNNSIETISNFRKKYLFNDSNLNDFDTLLKNFKDVSVSKKKNYFSVLVDVNKKLADYIDNVFKEFNKRLCDKDFEYLQGSKSGCFDELMKKYFE